MKSTPVTQEINMTLSHHQLQIRSRAFNEDLCQWGDVNVEQGVIIHPGYITIDPFEEGTFNALVMLSLNGEFQEDPEALRRLVVPFDVLEMESLEVLSVQKSYPIELPLVKRSYALYYEQIKAQYAHYKLTFVPSEVPVQAQFLMDDDWGGTAGRSLAEGYK